MSELRSQVGRRTSNTTTSSSDLSDPLTDIEDMFQHEPKKKERKNKGKHAQASDMNMDEDDHGKLS